MRTAVLTEDQAVQNLDFPIEVKIYEGGAQVPPSSATITIKDPDGAELVSDATMSIEGSVGTLTYTLTAEKTTDLLENALIEIEYTVSGIKDKLTFFFDVVIQKLLCAVADADLKNYFPDLTAHLWTGETSYSKQIDEAFRVVKRDIKNKGRRPAMLIDGSQVRELVIVKTLGNIFFAFSKAPDDIWWARYEKALDQYQALLEGLLIKYDEDEDGLIDSAEKKTGVGQVSMVR